MYEKLLVVDVLKKERYFSKLRLETSLKIFVIQETI